ncbi:hypothetical protein QQF64_003515 [Cirrhinus molitorella]|uniref:MHC class I antigen n=1 Tax=Cirrhinus molitorella TaxID=172907 RepID=A0ABR3MLH8_9TELE
MRSGKIFRVTESSLDQGQLVCAATYICGAPLRSWHLTVVWPQSAHVWEEGRTWEALRSFLHPDEGYCCVEKE